MKYFSWILILVQLTLPAVMMQGCSDEESATLQPRDTESIEVVYTGDETLEQVIESLRATNKSSVGLGFSEDQKQQIIRDFLEYQNLPKDSVSPASSAWYGAYASHYVRTPTDTDLWLEYKWWAGTQRPYHFETPIWALYWAIRVCYGGRIVSWPWMEGGYQRVTGVVGSCVYVPFGDAFLRYYLRVVPH